MTFFERTEEEIVSNAIEKLSKNTNISQLSPGSKARFLLDTISEEQANQHAIFDSNLSQSFIRFADSRFLDFFGDMLNLPRREATFASAEEGNFIFYVSSGTFGYINGGADIEIPSGQVVSTVPFDGEIITPGIESQSVVEFITTEEVVCSSSESFVTTPIQATIEGSNSVVPQGVLNQHSFTNYETSTNNLLKCTNRFSISNGEDRESDDSYRFRLLNIFKARNTAVPAAIRLAALSVPGVSDIKEVLCEQGIGSYSIYIQSTTPLPSPQLLKEVANILYSVTGYGIRPFILSPEALGVEFVCAITWASNASQENIATGYRQIRNAVEAKINQLIIGEELVFDELISIILNASTYARSVGATTLNKFEEIYLYRNDPVSEGTIRSLFVGEKIQPLYNEKIILNTSGRYRGIQFITRQS